MGDGDGAGLPPPVFPPELPLGEPPFVFPALLLEAVPEKALLFVF